MAAWGDVIRNQGSVAASITSQALGSWRELSVGLCHELGGRGQRRMSMEGIGESLSWGGERKGRTEHMGWPPSPSFPQTPERQVSSKWGKGLKEVEEV